MSYLYHLFFFDPLYNFFLFLFKALPWADAGVIVILLTVLVRVILYPLSKKAVLTQARMSEIAPDLDKIKEKYKDKPEEQARQTLALYREKKVNPFSGILVIIIQIPLILALYQVFLRLPEGVPTTLFNFLDIGGKSVLIALLAAVSTYFQIQVSSKHQKAPKGNSFGDNLAKSMQTQMKYVFPVIAFFVSYQISAVIALYWFTTNLFSIAQEIFVRRHLQPNSPKA